MIPIYDYKIYYTTGKEDCKDGKGNNSIVLTGTRGGMA